MESILSKEEAGKAIAEAEQKAYYSSSPVYVSIRVVCGGAADMLKCMHRVYREVAKSEFGIAYNKNSYHASEPAIAHIQFLQDYFEPLKCVEELCTLDDNDDSIMSIRLNILGNNPEFRQRFNEHYYFRKNIEDLHERFANKPDVDKASEVAAWLMEKSTCIPDENISAEAIFQGKSIGHEGSLASVYETYADALGIECVKNTVLETIRNSTLD